MTLCDLAKVQVNQQKQAVDSISFARVLVDVGLGLGLGVDLGVVGCANWRARVGLGRSGMWRGGVWSGEV